MSTGQTDTSLAICCGCGANVPTAAHARDCSLCHVPYPQPPLTVGPQADGLQLVQVRAGFACRSCGFMSPLGGLIQNETVTCEQCGLAQRMPEDWEPILDAIHATADLAGPFAAARDENAIVGRLREEEYQNTCITRPHTEIASSFLSRASIAVAASPGHPVCTACGAALEISLVEGQTHTRCPGCSDQRRYTLPPDLTPKNEHIVGIIALEHQLGIERLAPASGKLTSLKCPGCGANLPASPEVNSVTCDYCSGVALVPTSRATPDPSKRSDTRPFWVFFRGASPKRADMEKQARIEMFKKQHAERCRTEEVKRYARLAHAREAGGRRSRIRIAIGVSLGVMGIALWMYLAWRSGSF